MTQASERVNRGIRSVAVGIAVNVVLVLIKGTSGYLGNSYALIADAIESTTDIFTSIVVYIGLRIARTPPDSDHPYGHGKAEPLAAAAVALGLVAAAILIAIASVHEIRTPHRTPAPFTLAVLAGVVLIKELLFRHVIGVGESIGSNAVKSDAWHHRSDAITSALAFVGIAIALLAGPGYESADDWAALAAAAVIVFNAYRLLRPALADLLDTSPHQSMEQAVRSFAASVPQVVGLDKCYVRKMGFEYYVDLHVIVDGALSVSDGHRIAHQVKDAIRAGDPRIAEVLVHVEPGG